jgi:HSP20 family molecular chaperone IbpA
VSQSVPSERPSNILFSRSLEVVDRSFSVEGNKGNEMKRDVAAKSQQPGRPAMFILVEGDAFSRHLQTISEAIAHRAYELFERDGRRDGRDLQNWYRAESQFLQPVPVEIRETDHNLIVRAHIPGFTDKQVELGVASDHLIITGKNRTFDHRSRDVRPTEICRNLNLRAEIEPGKATARFIDGRLEVTLPKAAASRKGPTSGKAA